jgi:hypothetical protein
MNGVRWTQASLLLGIVMFGWVVDGGTLELNMEGSAARIVYEFRNGLWFDGNGFVEQTYFTQHAGSHGIERGSWVGRAKLSEGHRAWRDR